MLHHSAMAPGMTSDSSRRGSICLWGKWHSMSKSQPALESTAPSYERSMSDFIEEEIERIKKKRAESEGAAIG